MLEDRKNGRALAPDYRIQVRTNYQHPSQLSFFNS